MRAIDHGFYSTNFHRTLIFSVFRITGKAFVFVSLAVATDIQHECDSVELIY